jgi:hypothetical protein
MRVAHARSNDEVERRCFIPIIDSLFGPTKEHPPAIARTDCEVP